MQIAQKFDPVTLGKIKKSALISAAGFVVAALSLLQPNLLELVKENPLLTMFVSSFCPFLVNSIREWLAGQKE